MADEESSTQPSVKPNILPARKWNEVLARAQRIADLRGFPPYSARHGDNDAWEPVLSDDEAAVLSEFVYFWQPYLTLKAKT